MMCKLTKKLSQSAHTVCGRHTESQFWGTMRETKKSWITKSLRVRTDSAYNDTLVSLFFSPFLEMREE